MIWILIAVAWWGSGIIGYLIHKHTWKRNFNHWTKSDRNGALFFVIVLPFSIFIGSIMMWATSGPDNDEEASW